MWASEQMDTLSRAGLKLKVSVKLPSSSLLCCLHNPEGSWFPEVGQDPQPKSSLHLETSLTPLGNPTFAQLILNSASYGVLQQGSGWRVAPHPKERCQMYWGVLPFSRRCCCPIKCRIFLWTPPFPFVHLSPIYPVVPTPCRRTHQPQQDWDEDCGGVHHWTISVP